MSTVALAAFELGKGDAIICHSKNGKVAAQLPAKCLNKVYGRKYTLKAANAAGSAAGIYVGLPAPGVKNPAADDREYCVLHVDDSKLFLYGNAKYKCDMCRFRTAAEQPGGVVCRAQGKLPGLDCRNQPRMRLRQLAALIAKMPVRFPEKS